MSKVYTDFYRLCEDLDFSISVPLSATRTERRRSVEPLKAPCNHLPDYCSHVAILDPMRGANQSTQYVQTLGYETRITGQTERIQLEFGLREPMLLAPRIESARTLLASPFTGNPLFPAVPIRVMALQEIWAEKIRAALCRRNPAIRDFFDLDYALRNNQIDPSAVDFVALVARKLAVDGNGPIQLTDQRRMELDRQIRTDLRPVLRASDFAQFDLDRVWSALVALASHLKEI